MESPKFQLHHLDDSRSDQPVLCQRNVLTTYSILAFSKQQIHSRVRTFAPSYVRVQCAHSDIRRSMCQWKNVFLRFTSNAHYVNSKKPLVCEEPNWRIGGGLGGITKEQVLLIGAVHVTYGSLQPILQLNRYVFPRCQRLSGLP